MIDTKVALLEALTFGETYGLDLIRIISVLTAGKWAPVQGRVYPALHELESEGMVISRAGDPIQQQGGRARKYYRLTPRGHSRANNNRRAILSMFSYND